MKVGKKWQVGVLAGAMALGLAFTAGTASAQDNTQQQNNGGQGRRNRGQGGGAGGAFGRNPTQTVEALQKQVNELKLADDQKTKLDAIFKDAETQAKTLTSEVQSLQGQERRDKMMAFNRDLREKVNGVLTEEQRQTLRKNQGTAAAKQMVEGQRRRLADLGLSDDQKTKVEAVLADAEKKMADAMAQAQPGDGQGGGGARGGPMAEVMRDTREKINQILTPEQQQKLQASGPGRGQGGGRRGAGAGGAGAGN